MKTSLLLCLLLATALSRGLAAPLDSTIVYQGRLTDAGSPANGTYDLRFTLYDAVNGGNPVGGLSTSDDLSVANGLFNATLDFGFTPFDGTALWLELAVRPGNSAGAYVALTPRQPMTTAPYALYAVTAARAYSSTNVTANGVNNAALQDATITGGKIAGGQVVKSFNGLHDAVSLLAGDNITLTPNGQGITIAAPGVDDDWHLLGNLGTTPGVNFLGTIDNQPLEVRVNNTRALRLEPNASGAPNVIAGSPLNAITPGVVGATIGGGGALNYNGAPLLNRIEANFGTIGGGPTNLIAGSAESSTIGGGATNLIERNATFATIGGGTRNNIQFATRYSTVGGGTHNLIGAETHGVTIGGGGSNAVFSLADWATIGGGNQNHVEGSCDFGTIGGGEGNVMRGDANFATIGGGRGNFIDTNALVATIGGGLSNSIGRLALVAVIGGGELNRVEFGADRSVIGGGWSNSIGVDVERGTIAGGENNVLEVNAAWGAIGGGARNRIGGAAYASSIGGGHDNLIFNLADRATIAGGAGNEISTNADFSAIVGGLNNRIGVGTEQAFIGGGWANSIGSSSTNSTIGGGYFNRIFTNSPGSTIAGGQENRVEQNARAATIAGGRDNVIQTNADYSFIAGGQGNVIKTGSTHGVIGGGTDNVIETAAFFSTISGGIRNTTRQNYAVVPGGRLNAATGDYSFAAGHRAKAQHDGAFVWADSQNDDFGSSAPDQVRFRCQGGVRFTSGSALANQTVSWTPGNASWTFSSDRNLKDGHQPVDARAVLEKVSRLPMSEWSYKGHAQRHIGPMAQDFHAQFPLNDDDTMLDSGDLHGVALAAIQGLNAKLESEATAKDARIAALEQGLAELRQALQALRPSSVPRQDTSR